MAVAELLEQKEHNLFSILESMERVMVAYSGGTDSAYLAWAAGRVLGEGALAVTADSASIPESHKKDAEEFVQRFGSSINTSKPTSSRIPTTSATTPTAVSTARTNCSPNSRTSVSGSVSSTSSTASTSMTLPIIGQATAPPRSTASERPYARRSSPNRRSASSLAGMSCRPGIARRRLA